MAFKKVKREKAKAKICLTGASGGGKTLSALYLAYGITGDWDKIAVLDTEHSRASLYAERSDLPYATGSFLHDNLDPPYSAERYIEKMKEAEEAVGEDGVIIIDSGSHCWKGTGGMLDFKEQVAAQRGKTDFSAWADVGKKQNSFIDAIMDLKCHCIITLRSKADYVQEKDPETGKTNIKKVGLAPIQRDDFEYEFMLVVDLDKDSHTVRIIKDNTFLDAEGFCGQITPDLGKRLAKWLNEGVEPVIYNCEVCGNRIKTSEVGNKVLTPEEIVQNSKKKFKKCMCINCVLEENKKIKEAKEQEKVEE